MTNSLNGALVTPNGAALIAYDDGAGYVSTDSGRTWFSVDLPGLPVDGDSFGWAAGTGVLVISGASGELVLAMTHDDGASWTKHATPADAAADRGDVEVVHEDAVRLIMTISGSSNFAGFAYVVAGAPTELTSARAPASGRSATHDTDAVFTGGVLDSFAFSSSDQGRTWSPASVDGTPIRARNIDPNATSLSDPLWTAGYFDVAGLVQAPERHVTLFASTTGERWQPVASATTTVGDVSAGVAPLLRLRAGQPIVTIPGSPAFAVQVGSQLEQLAGDGLPAPVDAFGFSDSSHGVASVIVRSCASGKTGCAEHVEVYRTDDGGNTWAAIEAP